MPRYILAFDDSGGVEPLVDWRGEPILGDHPIVMLSAFYVDADSKHEFETRWNSLRHRIAMDLNVVAPPPIHMRLMWGRTLPPKARARTRNPYLDAGFDQIQGWVSECWMLIHQFVERRQAGWFVFPLLRSEQVAQAVKAFASPQRALEHGHMRARSSKLYRGFHRISTSPLLRAYSQLLLYTQVLTRATGTGSSVDILVDSFNDAHGIDQFETVSTMKRLAGLDAIQSITRIPDADEQPVVQAADVVGFTLFRLHMGRHGFLRTPDEILRGIVAGLTGQTITSMDVPHVTMRRYPMASSYPLGLLYALARAHVATRDPDYAAAWLVDETEFLERAIAAEDYVSILKDLEVPIMAKTPD